MTAHHDQVPRAEADDSGSGSTGLARKLAVGTAGTAVTAAGVVMLVTPGPGIVVTLAGLGILSSEFPAARRALERIRSSVRSRPPSADDR